MRYTGKHFKPTTFETQNTEKVIIIFSMIYFPLGLVAVIIKKSIGQGAKRKL